MCQSVSGFVRNCVRSRVDGYRGPDPQSPPIFLGFFAVWAVMMLTWFANLGWTVYMTIRASNGQWSGYPIVGALVRRFGGYDGAAERA